MKFLARQQRKSIPISLVIFLFHIHTFSVFFLAWISSGLDV